MTRRRTLIVGWTLALLAIAAFASLGRWQAQRANAKQAMLAAAAQVLAQRRPVALAQAANPARARAYDWAAGSGTFDVRGPLWLDNQPRHGRAGVRAYRLFYADTSPADAGTPLLVELGWLPLPPDRAMPAVVRPPGRIVLRGLLVPPPAPGLALGAGLVRQGDGWVLTRVEPAAIAARLALSRPLAPRVLRLDPALPFGYERDLVLLGNTLSPERHRGYAVQWYALAAAVLITALILTFRKTSR